MSGKGEVVNALQKQDIIIQKTQKMFIKLYTAPEEIWTLDPWFTRPVL